MKPPVQPEFLLQLFPRNRTLKTFLPSPRPIGSNIPPQLLTPRSFGAPLNKSHCLSPTTLVKTALVLVHPRKATQMPVNNVPVVFRAVCLLLVAEQEIGRLRVLPRLVTTRPQIPLPGLCRTLQDLETSTLPSIRGILLQIWIRPKHTRVWTNPYLSPHWPVSLAPTLTLLTCFKTAPAWPTIPQVVP